MTGISVAKIARIELKGTGTDEELEAYRSALKVVLGDVLDSGDPGVHTGVGPDGSRVAPVAEAPTASPAITGLGSDGSIRTTEWNGLRRKDLVRVRGLDGQYMFLFYHKDDRQEYVEVSGPVVRYRGELRGTRIRDFVPERIILTSTTRRR